MATTQIFYSPVPLVQAAVWAAVTPSDTNDLPVPLCAPASAVSTNVCKGLYFTASGNVTFLPANNRDADTITIAVVAGQQIGGFIRRILATGSTATGIYALY